MNLMSRDSSLHCPLLLFNLNNTLMLAYNLTFPKLPDTALLFGENAH